MEDLCKTIKQFNLTDIYETLCNQQQITYYCQVHTEHFTKIVHILRHKTILHMVKKIQVIKMELK